MRNVLGSLVARLVAPVSYLRLVFVLIGAAIALALGIAEFTVLSLIAGTGVPRWVLIMSGIVLIGSPLLIGVIPAVRQIEGVAVQTLLVVRFADGPPGFAQGWQQRTRTLGWFVLHVAAGALPVAGVMAMIWLGSSPWTIPMSLAALVITVVIGDALAALAPALLGPSYAERLEQLTADVARATERNRLAREIHDSIGHALSLVTLQASAARKLIDRDPAFTQEALATIETTSRSAVADLDHLLGLLRDERQPGTGATPTLDPGSLDDLMAAARAAGLSIEQTVSGDLTRLPVLVAQEAYRIIQEGLTNALKYSTDGTAVFQVSRVSDRLDIRLSNPADRDTPARVGRGLRGMDERAGTLGGSCSAGRDRGRWTLCIMLPAPPV